MTVTNIKVVAFCRCGRQLTEAEAHFGNECSDCAYLHSLGIYTIEAYNQWLKKNQEKPRDHSLP